MSTPPQPPRASSKTAAKRRSAARRRNREFLQRFFALFFVAIFILGTATTAFVFTNQQAVIRDTPVPAAQTSPTGAGLAVDQLEQKGDEYVAQNDMASALSSYSAAASLDQQNAQLQYKIGNILVQQQKYGEAAAHLQLATQLDPSGTPGAQSKALLDQYQGQIATAILSTPAATALSSTGGITSTTGITNSSNISDTAPITSTNPSPTK